MHFTKSLLLASLVFAGLLLAAGTASAQYDGCGDADQSGSQELADVTFILDYLYANGPAPDSLHLMNMDGRPGITIADAAYLWQCLFDQFHLGCNVCRDTLPYETSNDTVYLWQPRLLSSPTQRQAELWVGPQTKLHALSFPFRYYSTSSSVVLDSIVYHALQSGEAPWHPDGTIDTAAGTGLIALWTSNTWISQKTKVATLFFTLTNPLVTKIEIDTTTLADGQTYAAYLDTDTRRPTLLGASTTGDLPTCCEGETGDVNADGNKTLTDLTLLVNHLFVTFEPLACPAAANMTMDRDCNINLTDLTRLVADLFVCFSCQGYCSYFSHFACD